MTDLQLRIYHFLPPSLQSVAATLYGLYLWPWRYGLRSEQLVQEALERDYWSPKRWKAWHGERLAFVLHRAATKVPFYRNQWSIRRRHGDNQSWEYLENWPVLRKEDLRKDPRTFVADDCDLRRMYREQTSG